MEPRFFERGNGVYTFGAKAVDYSGLQWSRAFLSAEIRPQRRPHCSDHRGFNGAALF